MDKQVVLPQDQRLHRVDELENGDKYPIDTYSLSYDKDNKLWVKANAAANKGTRDCATISKDDDGLTIDLSGCAQDKKFVMPDPMRKVAEPDYLPIKNLKGTEPSLLESWEEYFQGTTPPMSTLPQSIDGQAILPTNLKYGGRDNFKPGETGYQSPMLHYTPADGRVWLLNPSALTVGKPTQTYCMRVDFLNSGVNIDASQCSRKGVMEPLPNNFSTARAVPVLKYVK